MTFWTYMLSPHPDALPSAIKSVSVRMGNSDGSIRLSYEVTPGASLVTPAQSEPQRADGLWQTTCFELFLKDHQGDGYSEFNFSPSNQWAAYRFDGYREGMRNMTLKNPPVIARFDSGESFVVTVAVVADVQTHAGTIALAAVIEEVDGTKSYWALAHPPGKPDFHHPSCFTVTLPPPELP